MKNNYILIIILGICVLAMGLFGFLWFNQNKAVADLQSQFLQAEDELNNARKKQASRTGDGETRAKEDERVITAAIPYNEREPFAFIKGLTQIAAAVNIKNIKFTASTPQKAGARAAAAGASGVTSEGVYSISIQMSAEGEFYQLVNFLKALNMLERVVTVDSVKVERDDKILPCQRITLNLKVYTYLAPDASL